MAQFLIFVVIFGLLVGLLSSWRRNRRLLLRLRSAPQARGGEQTKELDPEINGSKRYPCDSQSVLTRSRVSFFSQMQTRVAGLDRELIAPAAHMI